MSLDIWMRCEGPSRLSALLLTAWRVVEAQHKVSTRRLVDTLDEQRLLEQIVDEVKPPIPAGPGFAGLHYLLSTPFRHPPLRHGSRFGSSGTRWKPSIRLRLFWMRRIAAPISAPMISPSPVELLGDSG